MTDEQKPDLIQRLREGIGTTVRRRREEMNLSQAELAKLADTSQQTVDRIERGRVEHSRALPRIRQVLDIPNEGFNPDRFNEAVHALEQRGQESYKRFMEEGKVVSALAAGGRIPIYAPGDGTGLRLMNAVSRGYPVEFTEGAYGLVMFGTEMEPALRNGEIAIINPNLPPLWQSEVAVVVDGKPIIRTLVGETETEWTLHQWNPPKKIRIPKDGNTSPELVVAKIGRSV